MSKKEEEKKTVTEIIADKTNSWIGKNSKLLVISCIAVLVIIIGLLIGFGVNSKVQNNYRNSLTSLEASYTDLKGLDSTTDEYKDASSAFVANAEKLAKKSGLKSYVGAKAELLLGDFYFESDNLADAEAAYQAVANNQKKSYLSQVAKMDLAAAYENENETDKALEVYTSLWDQYGKEGLYGSRVLYNEGRIYEAKGQTELAKSVYNQLVDTYSSMNSEYAKLAKTRLAQLNK